jgi:hypothetical protein
MPGSTYLLAVWHANSNYNFSSPDKMITKHGSVRTFGGVILRESRAELISLRLAHKKGPCPKIGRTSDPKFHSSGPLYSPVWNRSLQMDAKRPPDTRETNSRRHRKDSRKWSSTPACEIESLWAFPKTSNPKTPKSFQKNGAPRKTALPEPDL